LFAALLINNNASLTGPRRSTFNISLNVMRDLYCYRVSILKKARFCEGNGGGTAGNCTDLKRINK